MIVDEGEVNMSKIKILFTDNTVVVYEIGQLIPVFADEDLDNTVVRRIDKIVHDTRRR